MTTLWITWATELMLRALLQVRTSSKWMAVVVAAAWPDFGALARMATLTCRASWEGVAPNATLYIYKVFNSVGSTDEDTLIEAFLDAYNAGVSFSSLALTW